MARTRTDRGGSTPPSKPEPSATPGSPTTRAARAPRAAERPATTAGATDPASRGPARAATRRAAEGRVEVGDRAPSFALSDDRGVIHRTEDYAGRPSLIYFYPKALTSGCTTEARQFSELALDLPILAISPDPPPVLARFRAKHELTITLLSDPEHRVAEAYGAWGEKVLYGKRSLGVIRSTFLVGADGRIERIWRPVRKADGHAAEVATSLPPARPRRGARK